MKRRHQLDINADNIVTTTGVVTALKIAVNAFTAPGDAIIINKPRIIHLIFLLMKINVRKLNVR
ncbi:MAG: hypothetical protein ACLTDM_13235 [Clostridium butyricum]